MAAFLEGVSSPYCLMMLAREALRTITDLREELNKQIRDEELLGRRNLSAFSRLIPLWKDEKDETSPNNKENKKKNKEEIKCPKPKRKPQQYTPLTALIGEIVTQMDQAELPPLKKMKTPKRKKGSFKYCRYHRDHGHGINHCWKLKHEIEKLIQRGLIRQYVGRNDNRPPKDDRKNNSYWYLGTQVEKLKVEFQTRFSNTWRIGMEPYLPILVRTCYVKLRV